MANRRKFFVDYWRVKMVKYQAICAVTGCNYPEGECSGACITDKTPERVPAHKTQFVAVCTSLSRAEFHDHAWAMYHAKTLDDPMLQKMCIHSMRALFDAIYDALPKVAPQPQEQKRFA
jgi:hypothetical protein